MTFLGRDSEPTADPTAPERRNPLARIGLETPPVTTDSPEASSPDSAADASRPTIGRLTRLPAVELWGGDPEPVVAWLAVNVGYLAEVIGVPLVPSATPEAPGSPNALLAAGPDGEPVLIVVELGSSSDERFGVLLRQMVASTAKTAVWVSGEPKPDHVASASWLNRAVDCRFYVVRLEAVRIGESAAAPVFSCVLRPPRATDAVRGEPAETGSAPDGRPRRRAEDWSVAPEAAVEPGG
jgi:hypothetical protein